MDVGVEVRVEAIQSVLETQEQIYSVDELIEKARKVEWYLWTGMSVKSEEDSSRKVE